MEINLDKVEMRKREDTTLYLIIKRLFDVLSCSIGLVLLSPIYLIVAIVIKFEDPNGEIFYSHYRIGKNGKKFPVYKFRSMFSNSDELFKQFTPEQKAEFEEFQKLKNDPRITRVGKFIRKTSIDELPQLINVLKGEMSVIGPRPIIQKELDRYGEYQDVYLSVLPGLTGMWQAYGRNHLTFKERIKMDVFYVNNRGILLDLKILFRTVITVLRGKGAA